MSDPITQRSESDLTVDRVNNQLSGKIQEYHDLGYRVQHDSAQVMLYPKHQPVQAELASHVLKGKATASTIYRAYKNTPHSPIALLGKYIVHRVNNVDSYDNAGTAQQLDHDFMVLHKRGKAAEKNGHVWANDLHMLMAGNPSLVRDMVVTRDRLQNWIKNGSGLNIKEINAQPYVALTRGLHTQVMSDEHSLASFSDLPHSGFGSVQHHVWMPLKDIWFTFMAGPEKTRGQFGHENEVLASNVGSRYQAAKEDVKPAVFSKLDAGLFEPNKEKGVSAILSGASPEHVSEALQDPEVAPLVVDFFRSKHDLPPVVARSIYNLTKDPVDIIGSSEVPEEEAMKWLSDAPNAKSPHDLLRIRERAIKNPNLSTSSLVNVAQSAWLRDSRNSVQSLVAHPNFTLDVAKAMVANVLRTNDGILTAYALSELMKSDDPPKQIQDIILSGLTPEDRYAGGIRGAWLALQAFNGTKKNDVVNTDFSDKLIAKNVQDLGQPHSYVVSRMPLSDAAVKDITEKYSMVLDSMEIDRNPFLTPRQIAILGNSPSTLQKIAFENGAKPEIKKLAREALFRLEPDRILGYIMGHLSAKVEIGEPDDFSDAELAKLGGMLRKSQSTHVDENDEYVGQTLPMNRLISLIPVTRLNAWKNLMEKPESVDKLAEAIRQGKPLTDVAVKEEDRRLATNMAYRIVAASEGVEEDPHKHIVIPLPRV